MWLTHAARTMRLVTYVGVCDEVGESEYGANETTHLINTPALSGGERHQFVAYVLLMPFITLSLSTIV